MLRLPGTCGAGCKGEPAEAALVAGAANGYTVTSSSRHSHRRGIANSSRKMMSVVVHALAGCSTLRVRLMLLAALQASDGVCDEARSEFLAQNHQVMADKHFIVMASARRDWEQKAPQSCDPLSCRHDMVFVGLSGMIVSSS